LMLCYPDMMVRNAMNFFKHRFRNHQKLYQHHTTVAACYMVCDILLLAEPFYRGLFFDSNEGDANQGSFKHKTELSISRAMLCSGSYLNLKDSILDIIATTNSNDLEPARQLLYQYQARQLYKRVATQSFQSKDGKQIDIQWQKSLWEMEERDIVRDIIKCGQLECNSIVVTEDDLIVKKVKIHHGMNTDNPVNCMRFLCKTQLSKLSAPIDNLPLAEKIEEKEYYCEIPRAFFQRSLIVFCRKHEKRKREFLETCYHQFIDNIKKRSGGENCLNNKNNDEFEDLQYSILTQSPPTCSNDSFAVAEAGHNFYPTERNDTRKRVRRNDGKRLFSMLEAHLNSP